MKPFLVDVPVKINIWIRKDCLKMQFEQIKKARPSILFIQSDGGRNETEWECIYANRKMIDEGIDWDCKVYRVYESENQGLYTMDWKMFDFVFQEVDRCIFLEDDDIPSVSFFRFCAELLEKYKDDQRIECICGMNHFEVSENVTADYFFSRVGSIWGTATWRRSYQEWGRTDFIHDPYTMQMLKNATKDYKAFMKRIDHVGRYHEYDGHKPNDEFWKMFSIYAQNRLQIIPKYNMICNVGSGANAAHNFEELEKMPPRKRKMFNMKTYEMSFPLNHNNFVIPDVAFERNRNKLMNIGYPWGRFTDMLYIAFYRLCHADFKWFALKIKKRFAKKTAEK